MDERKDLRLLLNSQVPLVVVETHEEGRVLDLLKDVNLAGPGPAHHRPLYRWTVTDGLQRLDIELEPQLHNSQPTDVLRHIRAVEKPGLYVLLDFHPYLDDPVIVRLVKDICLGFRDINRHLVLISHRIELPSEIERYSARLELSMPSAGARDEIVRRVAREWAHTNAGKPVRTDRKAYELLIRNLGGLTAAETERLARNAIFRDGAISAADIPEVMRAKYELLNRSGLLSYEYETADFAEVGGLSRLKTWLEHRRGAFLRPDAHRQLDLPRGLLLVGIQGCGKSLAAKATAGVWGLPLLRLDFGALYNKYHGETERNLRETLRTAEVMAPCVLWIDELEKGIAGGRDESGTSRRVLATFLTWMAEKRDQVFVVATANEIDELPPELVRKGRFDEIFFVDLPGRDSRRDIFALHLSAREQRPEDFDLDALADATHHFSGAEIEQAIVSALYTLHGQDRGLDTGAILAEIEATRPLAVVMAERIGRLRRWADGRTVPAD
ncbi:MAG: AAA family ATPase [Gammaproteobacteria bacterium]|jgi:hypothetical protein